MSSSYPNLTQHLTQCKTSPHAHDPTHHHPILTRPPHNLSEIQNLPSNLQHSPLTPHSNTCHHLLPPSPPKTTTTSIRNRPPMATHRHNHPCQRHTTLEIQLLRPWHRPSLGPAQGPTPNGGHVWIRSTPPKRCPPTVCVARDSVYPPIPRRQYQSHNHWPDRHRLTKVDICGSCRARSLP